MKIIPFIKKIVVGFLLVQSQTSVMAAKTKDNMLVLSGEDAPNCDDADYNPCEAFGFHVVAGKATRHTTRWMLGEFHSYSHMTDQCLAELINLPGKTSIYFEGTDHEEGEIECPSHLEKMRKNGSEIECFGWDDMGIQYDGSSKDPLSNALGQLSNCRDFYIKSKLSDDQFDTVVHHMKKELHINNQELYENVPKRLLAKRVESDKMFFNWLQNERKQGQSYNEIFTKYIEMTKSSSEVSPLTKDEVDKRNQCLMRVIRKHSNDQRAIVIAGAQHMFPTYVDRDPKTRQYIQRELEHDKAEKGVSYAILQFRP